MKNLWLKLSVLSVALFIGFCCLNVNFSNIFSLPSTAIISKSDINFLNDEDIFGKAISVNISDITASGNEKTSAKMWLKLFGFIPIKQITVELTSGEKVYVGGIPLGFAIKTDGFLVVGNNSVSATDGTSETHKTLEIKEGDIVKKINGETIDTFLEISEKINNNDGEALTLTINRGDEEFDCEVMPKYDVESGENKIGLWVKNDANGIGTLTFVKADNSRFGALGHAITDYETGVEIPIRSGKIYKCNQLGFTKAEKNSPGELRCIFLQGINQKGVIDKNTKFGVYGQVSDLASVVDNNLSTEIGSRLGVKTGKASIISSVSGVREEYEIEIIKTSYQPENDDKSFIFRVTDKRLLELTGGILQGMSGSPILQNGKLIGAITHVFVSDPTKGYGIYADWMANQ